MVTTNINTFGAGATIVKRTSADINAEALIVPATTFGPYSIQSAWLGDTQTLAGNIVLGAIPQYDVTAESVIKRLDYVTTFGASAMLVSPTHQTNLTAEAVIGSSIGDWLTAVPDDTLGSADIIGSFRYQPSYNDSIFSTNPASHFPLSETTGTVADDLMTATNGTYVGNPTMSIYGPIQNERPPRACYFNGSSQKVNLGTGGYGVTNAVSVAAWVKIPQIPDSTYRPVVLADDPAGYWPLNESTGSTAYDVLGLHNGQMWNTGYMDLSQSPLLSAPSTTASINFRGTGYGGDPHIDIAGGSSWWAGDGSACSIEIWADIPQTTGIKALIDLRVSGAENFYMVVLGGTGATQTLEARFTNSAGTSYTHNIAVTPGVHHLVLTKSGATLDCYVDNVKTSFSTCTGTFGDLSSRTTMIGRDAVYGFAFAGRLGHAAVYDHYLTDTQVANHYTAGTRSWNYYAVMSHRTSGNTGYELLVREDGKLAGFVGDGTNYNSSNLSIGRIDDDNWHFVCMTRASGGSTYGYVDGAVSTSFSSPSVGSMAPGAVEADIAAWGPGSSHFFLGSISHVAVWSRAITVTEIGNLYTNAVTWIAPVSITSVERENPIDGSFIEIFSISGRNAIFTDTNPPLGQPFTYRMRGYDSDGNVVNSISTYPITISIDKWSLTIKEGYNIFLDVISSSKNREIQTESFSPLGSTFKTVQTGKLLGRKGTIDCFVQNSERTDTMNMIDRIANDTRTTYIRSPFGDVIPVAIGNISEKFLDGGHSTVTIEYVELGAS